MDCKVKKVEWIYCYNDVHKRKQPRIYLKNILLICSRVLGDIIYLLYFLVSNVLQVYIILLYDQKRRVMFIRFIVMWKFNLL